MAIKYESGSTYFPGYTTSESVIEILTPEEVSRRALKNRRELALLDDPTINKVTSVLAERTYKPDQWIRNAVVTIERFSKEACDSDLKSALSAGLKDSVTADFLLQKYVSKHEDLTSVQLSSLLLGPKLWWTINGVPISWKASHVAKNKVHIANSSNKNFDPVVRLFLLCLLGTGLTYQELSKIRVKDVGQINRDGNLIHDLASMPMALEFEAEASRKLTFLGEEARAALVKSVIERQLSPDDLLFGNEEEFANIKSRADSRSRSIIDSVNDVNVTLCKTVGDFFLDWGIPGRNFYKENNLPNPHDE